MKYFVIISMLAIGCTSVEKLQQTGNYQGMIEKYARSINKNSPEINYLVAEDFRKSNRIEKALPFYEKALEDGIADPYAQLHYAHALKANQQYDKAQLVLENALGKAPNQELKELIENELGALAKLESLNNDESYYRVKNIQNLNTEYSEYSPVYRGSYLYFVSNRDGGKIYKTTGTAFTDIYRVNGDFKSVSTGKIQKLDPTINLDHVNEGTASLSADGRAMVFARANSGNPNDYSNVNLFYTRFRNGTWTNPRAILINDAQAWDSTPFLSADGQTLYFSSTREGGFGESDLYVAKLNRRGRWVDVRNLGPDINTAGHEQFPFLSEDGVLYFSSDGHIGLGKLDVFKARREGGKLSVENLGKPINSSLDDVGYYEYDATHGFFSSDREEGKGGDDLYAFINDDPDLKIVNYFLAGTVFTNDLDSGSVVISNSDVKILDKNDLTIDEVFTDQGGRFRFRVYPEEVYHLLGEKQNFFSTRKVFSTVGKSVNKETLTQFETTIEFEMDLFLDQIIIDKPIVLNDIYYDLDQASIRKDAEKVLDSLVTIMTDNPAIFIELSSYTDSRAEDDYNMDLSVRRAKAATAYIIEKGVQRERVLFKGYGESKLLIEDAQTEEEHQVNRRTEFKVLEYHPNLVPDNTTDEDRFFRNSGIKLNEEN